MTARDIAPILLCQLGYISLVLVFRSDLNGQANLAIIPRNCSLNFALLPEDFAFAAIVGFIWQLELAPCLCCLLSPQTNNPIHLRLSLMERRIFWRFGWWRFRFISVLRLFSELFAVSWCFIRNVELSASLVTFELMLQKVSLHIYLYHNKYNRHSFQQLIK